MAMESQGVQIRRISTASGSTAPSGSSDAVISASVSTVILRTDAGDFAADGWTTSMRLIFPGSTLNTGVYGIKSVNTTALGLFNAVTTFTTATGTISIQGNEYSRIAAVTGFNGPSGSAGVIDITSLDSTAKEKLIGVRDEGQLSLDVLLDNEATALQTALIEDRATRTKRTFDITFTDEPDSSSQPSGSNFDGYVSGFSVTGAVDDAVKAAITIEIDGPVHWIDAAS